MPTRSGSVSTPSARRPGGRTARVTDAVMRETIELLATGGFSAVSIEAVAERAGVHKTTVYRRWPTRGALVAAALIARPFRPPATVRPDTGSVRGDLRVMTNGLREIRTDPRTLAVARALQEGAGEPELAAASNAFWSACVAQVVEVLQRGVARGELPPRANVDVAATMLIGAVKLRMFDGDANDPPRWFRALADSTLSAAGAVT